MRAESNGRRFAISRAGAMGCMQLMPGTWAELSARYGLGGDPFHPRANMFGGAAYLRTMVDRFGWPSALAAYHAGPGRYQQHRDRARPLPPETRAYVAMIVTRTETMATGTAIRVATPDWRQASLFAGLSSDSRTAAHSEANQPLPEAAN
jgi:soluble lytic murein transglycosylase-like protein